MGQVQGTGSTQQETMDPGFIPCLGLVWKFLYNILGPINLGLVPCTCPGQMQCE